jgi:quinolinate synthase
MAESASILSPEKKVLLPVLEAGCPLADMIDAEKLRAWKREYPGRPVVTYINSSAEVKAESDICCTSSNAVDIVDSVESDEVLFCPDKNLGMYVQSRTEKRLVIWGGYCATHAWVKEEEIVEAKKWHPKAKVMAHPECGPEVLRHADHVCSTSGMLSYARESEAQEFIVATEAGILHRLKRDNPRKRFYIGSKKFLCPNMKVTTLATIADALEHMRHEVRVDEGVRNRAARAIDRMLKKA